MSQENGQESGQNGGNGKRPLIEWIAGGVGLVLTLVLLGFVGWQAISSPERIAPQIDVEVTGVSPRSGGFLVEITAENRATQTAAGVEVEGMIATGDGTVERSSVTFDYVPGHSEARGGLFFNSDPADGAFTVRALGYHRP